MSEQRVRQIVERCQQGDREAFGQLYTAMYDRLRGICRRYVSAESTIDDLLHDSFLLIFSKIDSVRDVAKAEIWMQRVTQNLSLIYLQQQKQKPVVSFDELNEPLTVAAPATMPVTYDEILNLVDALPNSYQRVFRLSVLEGLSHQEIAALLNIEPHTSSAQLVRAKKKLRQSLTIFLLGLLALFLPLGLWYALQQPTEVPSSPESTKATASVKPVSKQEDGETKEDYEQRVIEEYNDVSSISGIFKSFGDAPGGFKEELQEIQWSLGAEYIYHDQFSLRAGYHHESENKGNRKYFTVGGGFRMNVFSLDVGYVISTAKSNPLDQTLRFTLAFDMDGIKDLFK